MKQFVEHILKENYDECLSKSLINCHTKGLHSIMLIDKPEQRVRLFVTDKTHNMWTNKTINKDMSIAIHPHHCNVTLVHLDGQLFNKMYRFGDTSNFKLNTYSWQSPILGRDGHFRWQRNDYLSFLRDENLKLLKSRYMNANELHTVYIPKNSITSWVVIEGRENEESEPYCYSLNDLTKFDSSELYQKPTKKEFNRVIKLLNL